MLHCGSIFTKILNVFWLFYTVLYIHVTSQYKCTLLVKTMSGRGGVWVSNHRLNVCTFTNHILTFWNNIIVGHNGCLIHESQLYFDVFSRFTLYIPVNSWITWNPFQPLLKVSISAKSFYCVLGTTVKVHLVHLEKEKVAPYLNVRPLLSSTVRDLYVLIHEVRTVTPSLEVWGYPNS